MIAQLRGLLAEKHPNQAVIDCGGVGYDVHIPVSTFSALPESGQPVVLRIHTHVREDAIALFGFLTATEKQVFEKLIAISGIGPKLAITVLSGLNTADLIDAIRAQDLARLTRIPGVGKKTAERMVLELKDKLDLGAQKASGTASVSPAVTRSAVEEDVLSALANLGCARPAAETALAKAKAETASEEFEILFRKSLELVR